MTIFKTYAPDMWRRGLPVIPLRPRMKAPIIAEWSKFCKEPISDMIKAQWLSIYPNSNIGLPLGPSAGLLAIDVDTTDPQLITLLEKILPPSPWKRTGKKGFVHLYTYSGEPTEQIKDENNNVILELLGDGRQVVLPPSIHPDTQQPYLADKILVTVLDQVKPLPSGFMELAREELRKAGVRLNRKSGQAKVSEFIPEGARDNAMVSHAGILARAVTRGERSLMEAFSEMDHWCEVFTAQVEGDVVDSEKGKQRIVQFLQRDITGPRKIHLPQGWDAELPDEIRENMQILFSDDHEEWDFPKIRDYLIGVFKNNEPDSPERAAGVERALEKIARSKGLNTLERDRVLKWIKESSEMGDSIVSLRKRVGELSQGDILGTDHAEIANAVLNDMNQIGEVRYHQSKFWQWGGAYWRELDDLAIKKHIVEDYGDLPLGKRSSDHVGILRTMQAIAAKPLQQLEIAGINFANGFLTAELELLSHNPDFGATFVLPYRYLGEKAEKPIRFVQFLSEIWQNDPDFDQKVAAIREAFAVTLFGLAPQLNRAICLYGVAKSGKTQLLNVLEHMLPGYAVTAINPGDWDDQFLPAHMANSALNLCGELSETKSIDGDMFKRIVEGSKISGQYKHRPVFEFRPKCAQWFASNYLPKTRDASFGFGRRWLFLEFNRMVPMTEQKLHVGQSIAEFEREEIVAWAVEAIPALLARGDYTVPPSSDHLMGTMLSSNCSVRNWFNNSGLVVVTGSEEDTEQEAKLYECYKTDCAMVLGQRALGRARFTERFHMMMSEKGAERRVTDPQADDVSYKGVKIVKMLRRS